MEERRGEIGKSVSNNKDMKGKYAGNVGKRVNLAF